MAKAVSKSSLQRNILTASRHFHCIDKAPIWSPQKFQVQAKIPTIRFAFPDCLSVSYDYAPTYSEEMEL